MKKYPRNTFLPDRLELLMRLGLVDRAKLQQYKLAFKNPDANVRYQHYRDKILEVFYKVFDIIDTNDPIFIKMRQEVQRRYRNQKPMKKKLEEAAPKKTPKHVRNINAYRTQVRKWELNDPDKIHSEFKSHAAGKPEGMNHREWIGRRAILAASRTRLQKAKSDETKKVLDMISQASKEIKPLDHSKLPILGPDKFPSKPKPKPVSREDEMKKAYEVAHQNAGYDVGQGKVKLPKGKTREQHQHEQGMKAAEVVARKHKELDGLAKGELPAPAAPEKKKPGLVSRLLSKLSGKKSVSEGLSMSGGRAHLQSKSSGENAVKNDMADRQREKNQAQQRMNQQNSDRSRAMAARAQLNKANRGRPVT